MYVTCQERIVNKTVSEVNLVADAAVVDDDAAVVKAKLRVLMLSLDDRVYHTTHCLLAVWVCLPACLVL